MRLLCLPVLAAAALAATAAEARTRDIATSWGKPGVEMTQYRLDAGVCAAHATNTDLRGTPQAQTLVKASRLLDNAYETASMYNPPAAGGILMGTPWVEVARIHRSLRVGQTLGEVRANLTEVLHGCLEERGYRRFALTDQQRKRVKKLGLGSKKRRAYLHSLARDPEVLARQGL